MKNVGEVLDATYLKTAEQLGIEVFENKQIVADFVSEAIAYNFKLVMIRPSYVSMAHQQIQVANSAVLLGTVIDFPNGDAPLSDKLIEAQEVIDSGVDELDFVINYRAFQAGEIELVRTEVKEATSLCLKHQKTVKWIIEIAALKEEEIASISRLIKEVVLAHFATEVEKVFVKTSTGFFIREDGGPVGATLPAVRLISENAHPLPIKAAGGVRNLEEVEAMLLAGASRIGTSSAKEIVLGEKVKNNY